MAEEAERCERVRGKQITTDNTGIKAETKKKNPFDWELINRI